MSNSSVTVHKNTKEPSTNGWQELLPYIDPELISSIPTFAQDAESIPIKVITWLKNNALDCKWFDHLIFAVISAAPSELATMYGMIGRLHHFIGYCIPDYYNVVEDINPSVALIRIFREISMSLGNNWVRSYSSFSIHENTVIKNSSPINKARLAKFQLPNLVRNKELVCLISEACSIAQKKRKNEVHGVLRDWPNLKLLVPSRLKWITEFEKKYQEIKYLVSSHKIELPIVKEVPGFTNPDKKLLIKFWNHYSWMQAHQSDYSNTRKMILKDHQHLYSPEIFCQYIGEIPEDDWFLEAYLVDAIHTKFNADSDDFLAQRNYPKTVFSSAGLLHQRSSSQGIILSKARQTAKGSPDDSKIICITRLLSLHPF